jgi:hypothetical protein
MARKSRRRTTPRSVICKRCAVSFQTWARNVRYCSTACAQEVRRDQWRRYKDKHAEQRRAYQNEYNHRPERASLVRHRAKLLAAKGSYWERYAFSGFVTMVARLAALELQIHRW